MAVLEKMKHDSNVLASDLLLTISRAPTHSSYVYILVCYILITSHAVLEGIRVLKGRERETETETESERKINFRIHV